MYLVARFAEPGLLLSSKIHNKEPGSASWATGSRALRHGLDELDVVEDGEG